MLGNITTLGRYAKVSGTTHQIDSLQYSYSGLRHTRIDDISTGSPTIKVLGVTLDYLVKDGEYEQIDNEMLKRLKEVQGLDEENRAHIFATIDAFIKAAKLKSIAAL